MRGMGIVCILVAACSSPSATSPPPVVPVEPTAAQVPEKPTEPEKPVEAPLVWTHEKKVSADSKGCPVLRLRVEKAGETLGEFSVRDDCEADPSYDCKDSGEGCSTSANDFVSFVDIDGVRFAWVRHHAEWHDNGSMDFGLYGYGCGKVHRVWGYSWIDPSEETKTTVQAQGDWKTIVTTETYSDGEKHTSTRVWDASKCIYVPKK